MEIPGYDVKRTIGRGGMATVYLAIQRSLDREVVLKTLDTTNDESGDFFARFLKEGRIIASLRHPHIVTIFDIGNTDDIVYISMEYVEGGDLRARIGNGLSPLHGLELVSKIGQALAYAHKQGIVHRDVKPANILFRGDGIPLLSDFGIAKDFGVDKELTNTGTILGSPFYMSPEQAEGVTVDGRTDIYSLGVIFYEILTGQKPYEGDSAIKVIMHQIQSPVPQLPRELGQFQPLLNRLMAKDRDQRIADAGEVVTQVEELREEVQRKQARTITTLHTLKLPDSAQTRGRRGTSAGRGSRTARILTLVLVSLLVLGGLGAFIIDGMGKSTVIAHSPPPVQTANSGTATGPRTAGSTSRAIDRKSAFQALEWLAKNSLSQDRLMTPPADNAHYYFSRLLEISPDSEVAKQGFSAIAERFVVLAEEEFSGKHYDKAQAYITLGLQAEPNNHGLKTLRSMIETGEKSFFETVLDYFASN
jgi:serine/threonine protein kinase